LQDAETDMFVAEQSGSVGKADGNALVDEAESGQTPMAIKGAHICTYIFQSWFGAICRSIVPPEATYHDTLEILLSNIKADLLYACVLW